MRDVYDILVRVMTAAVEDEAKVIVTSPCKRITLPAISDEEVTPPTVAQVEAMAGVMPPYLRAAIVVPAGSGLRIGELLGLKVSDVDFKRGPSASSGSGCSPASSARRRPPSPGAPSRSERSSRTPSSRTSPLGPRRSGCSRWRRGEPLNYSRWKTEWKCARKAPRKAENEAAEREGRRPVELPHMVTHDLRRFHASALIAGGAGIKQVQLVLGHASAVITLRIYAHLWPGEEDRTRSVMDAVLGGLRTGCGQGDAANKEIAGQRA